MIAGALLAASLAATAVGARGPGGPGLDALFDGGGGPLAAWRKPWARIVRSIFQRPATLQGHEGVIVAARPSADGATITTFGLDRTLRVWDARSGRQLRSTPWPHGRVSAAAIAADASILAAAGGGSVKIADAAGALVSEFAFDAKSVALSPDRSMVAAGNLERWGVWDPRTGAPVCAVARPASALAFSPDGAKLLTLLRGLRMWDLTRCAELWHGQPVDEDVRAAAFSPDGRTVALAGSRGNLHLWDAASGRARSTLAAHSRYGATAVAFSPDGRRIASGGNDDTAVVWDVATGKALVVLPVGRPPDALAFSPDGSRLLTVSRLSGKLWPLGESAGGS